MSASHYPEVSRRGFLLAGLAGATAPVLPDLAGASASAALPTVKPIWSHKAYQAFGVCTHPNYGGTGYRYTNQSMTALASTGVSYFRGMYVHTLDATASTTRQARELGLKWGMTVSPDLSLSDAKLVARIKHIAANAADICTYIEGVNEPNYVRRTGAVPADWARRTVAKQKLIWQTVRNDSRLAHVTVVGPSLQAIVGDESHYRALGNAGIARYMDRAGMHRYSGGRYPNHLIDERLSWVKKYWGGKPTWITETGYTNAMASRDGHSPVPEDVSATYAPSSLLEAVDRNCNVIWYELLDDVDSGAKDDIEANFGMFATKSGMGPPWRAKPVVSSVKSFLSQLKDPGAAYSPPRIPLRVSSSAADVRSTVTAKRNGSVTVHLRRARNCWDPVKQQRIYVREVPVVIESAKGKRALMVDHHVRSITL